MKNLKFKKDAHDMAFFKVLRQRVDQYFKNGSIEKTANKKAKLKAVLLIALYIFVYVVLLISNSAMQLYIAYSLLGMLTIFAALNIAHDAAHGTFSSKKKVNNILLYVFDFLGANGYIWRLKHVYSHHPHVNIPNMDGDIKQSNLVRIFPDAQYLNFHKYQYIYMPILYSLYTLIWLLFRDFKDFFNTEISGKPNVKHTTKAWLALILGKCFYFSRMLLFPYLLLPFGFGYIALGFLIFHITAGLTVALALVSAHVGETSIYPKPNANGEMPFSYIRHQILTTYDFATDNKLITHLFGGFNHHVIHHLFPGICHIHYPELTKILKQTCIEYDMPYFSNPTLGSAILSHLKFLKIRSKQEIAVPYIEM